MKKKKNLLKTLALCSVIGLGVGYAVVSNQTLTYTETIPVGERTLNVTIADSDATNNGTTLEVLVPDKILEDPNNLNYIDGTDLYVPVVNNETDLAAEVSVTVTFYGDDDVISVGSYLDIYGFPTDSNEYTNILNPGEVKNFHIQYALRDVALLETYENIRIVVTLTAAPVKL